MAERKIFTAEQKKQAVEMVQSGTTVREVAELFGTTPVSVSRWVNPEKKTVGGKPRVKKERERIKKEASAGLVKALKARVAEVEAELAHLRETLEWVEES